MNLSDWSTRPEIDFGRLKIKSSRGAGWLRPADGPPAPPPDRAPAALTWLHERGGSLVISSRPDGTLLVAVGLLGRTGDAVASVMKGRTLERAFLDALAALHAKL